MGGRLRAVPEVPPRALGLVRVSDEGGRGDQLVSPDIQRASITDHSVRCGYDLVGFVEGIDESGSRAKSAWWPRLDQAITALEAGEYDVLVVWKFSRTARNRLRWAAALERVDIAGGRLESATEQVDVTTSAGRFTRGMFGEVAAFEAERIGEGWQEAHAARIRAGKPPTGRPKFGYVYDRAAKLHRPDPETGPVLAELYERYVAGESVYSLVRWLNGHGWRTTSGGLWTGETLRKVLDSGFGAGWFMAGGEPKRKIKPRLHRGVHEPVIDEELWQAYQDARAARRALAPRIERSAYVLSGLVKCSCGGPLVPGRYGNRVLYRCQRRYLHGLETCEVRYVQADVIDGTVLDWLATVAGRVDAATEAALETQVRRARRDADIARLRREVVAADEALARLAVQNARAPLPEATYDKAHGELTAHLEQLRAVLEVEERAVRATVEDPAPVAAGLLEGWDVTAVAVRRQALRRLLIKVVVDVVDGVHRAGIYPAWGGVWFRPVSWS